MIGVLRESLNQEQQSSRMEEPVQYPAILEDGLYVQAVLDAVRQSNGYYFRDNSVLSVCGSN